MGKTTKKQVKQTRFKAHVTKKIKKRSKKENSDITYQRRHSYFTDPARGGRGVCIKPHRMMRVMRAIRASLPEEFRVLLTHTKGRKQHFSEAYQRVAMGGFDALTNRVMSIASIICRARTGIKDDKGLPLRKSDMAAAIKLIRQLKH